MERTRKSFWFPVGYLFGGGLGLATMPDFALKLMGLVGFGTVLSAVQYRRDKRAA